MSSFGQICTAVDRGDNETGVARWYGGQLLFSHNSETHTTLPPNKNPELSVVQQQGVSEAIVPFGGENAGNQQSASEFGMDGRDDLCDLKRRAGLVISRHIAGTASCAPPFVEILKSKSGEQGYFRCVSGRILTIMPEPGPVSRREQLFENDWSQPVTVVSFRIAESGAAWIFSPEFHNY